jgi:hypothetical protein
MAQGTVPIAYRLALANVLTSAYAPDGAQTEEMEYCGENAVRLFAIWTGGEGDKMRRFKNLVHIFNVPSFEQYRRYRRDVSRSQVMGGSRKGTTVYRGAQRTLAALYDELIVAVMGYAANGVALDGREEIAQHMDTYHKVAAAAQLFTPEQLELDEEEES